MAISSKRSNIRDKISYNLNSFTAVQVFFIVTTICLFTSFSLVSATHYPTLENAEDELCTLHTVIKKEEPTFCILIPPNEMAEVYKNSRMKRVIDTIRDNNKVELIDKKKEKWKIKHTKNGAIIEGWVKARLFVKECGPLYMLNLEVVPCDSINE